MQRTVAATAALPGWRRTVGLEHLVTAAAAAALVVLVVLPLASLLWSSVTADGHLMLEHFRRALGTRMCVGALVNSLVLGAWTGPLSVAIGLPMALAVSRADVPCKGLVRVTANLAYLTPPFLTAIAFVNLFSPNAGLVNRVFRDVAGLPWATFDIFSMPGLVLVTVLHTFPYVFLLAAGALESADAWLEESARLLGAGRWRTAVAITAPYLSLLAVSLSKSWGLAFWQNLTLANYRFVLFEYDVTRRAIVNSLLLAAAAATLAVLLGSIVSGIDLRTAVRGRRLLDYVSLVPLGLPGIVVAAALIQFWLRVPAPLYGTLAIILLACTARFVPRGVRSANASLRQVDPSLEERARITGASWLRTLRSVTLPLIRPGLAAGWLLVFVPALQELSAPVLLFSSQSITLAVAVYNLHETGYLEPVAALAIVNALLVGTAISLAARLGRGGIGLRRDTVAR